MGRLKMFLVLIYVKGGLLREDSVVLAKVDRIKGVRNGDHLFMQFFARPDPDFLLPAIGRDGCSHVRDPVRGYLGNKNFAAPGLVDGIENHFATILQGNIKTSHPLVCYRKHTVFSFAEKKKALRIHLIP